MSGARDWLEAFFVVAVVLALLFLCGPDALDVGGR